MKLSCLALRLTAAAALILICLSAPAKPNRPQTTAVKNIQSVYAWSMVQDGATGGVSTGTMALVSKPSISGAARQFGISFQNSAGERYWSVFGADTTASNFTYDVKVYIASPSTDIANLEFRYEPGHGQRPDRHLRSPVRRLQHHLGLHHQRGNPRRPHRSVDPLHRSV